MNMANVQMATKNEVELSMRPVCECGHVFNRLQYNCYSKIFTPRICPNCNREIMLLKYKELTSYKHDSDGNINF